MFLNSSQSGQIVGDADEEVGVFEIAEYAEVNREAQDQQESADPFFLADV